MYMTDANAIKLSQQIKKQQYDTKKIRALLSADIQRFFTDEKVLKSLKMSSKANEALADLRKIVADAKYGKETVYAAIALSLFNESSGLSILKNHQRYWVTNSEIEKLHVRAALILLNESFFEKFQFLNGAMSPDLYREIKS